jgi:NAD+ diphosphatase
MFLDLPLSRTGLDRAAHLRSDESALAQMWQRAKIIELLGDRFRIHQGALAYANPDIAGERYFLGLDEAKVPYFVAHQSATASEYPEDFQSLRTIGKKLGALEIGAAVHALALAQWHEAHKMCARCGGENRVVLGGAVRRCSICATDHHPRTDPAIIVLVKDNADRILLGRQKVWPAGRFSAFAGFVEPGESFESAVIREVQEECEGIVTSMRYLGSQPWPFPASLMIAYEALISNPESVRPDGEEIEEIIWLNREELKRSVSSRELLLPPTISVARAMIDTWYGDAAKIELDGETWRN